MTDQAALAAADWGTSNLRLWLFGRDGAVLDERRSDDGMSSAASSGGFAAILEGHMRGFGAPADLPVVICGMAGARQGWIEAPYVDAPAPLAGFSGSAVTPPDAARPVRILPGMAQRRPDAPDVMRGEETKLAGVALLRQAGRHVVCMPGTHPKWAIVEDGALVSFRTALTGELFGLFAGHSILRHSLGEAPAEVQPDNPVFAEWLGRALARPELATALPFRIRASSLLFGMPAEDAAAALSGLLIGAEIAGAAADAKGRVVLLASGALDALYGAALTIAGMAVVRADADEAVRAGLFAAGRQLFPERFGPGGAQ